MIAVWNKQIFQAEQWKQTLGDGQCTDLKQVCLVDVMKRLVRRSREQYWKAWAERHEVWECGSHL